MNEMNGTVRVLDSAFRPEEELRDEMREVIRQYEGRISYAQLLGILEMLKFEYMQEVHRG